MYQYPHVMLNPGELTEGYQQLNEQCVACHTPFGVISNDKCIASHKLTDIGRDTPALCTTRDTSKMFLFHEQLSGIKCTSCHTDHKGVKPTMSLSRFHHEILPENVINNCNNCHAQPADNLH